MWPREMQEDSENVPQGPYPNGGGEADTPQHCDACGVFLESPLTPDGTRYVIEKLVEHAREGDGDAKVLMEWANFYNAAYYEPGEVGMRNCTRNTRCSSRVPTTAASGGSRWPASSTPAARRF